ncbi:unnamed protein product [Trichobilharzia szidati]|nr:unnamed protein product [Trichobilharzia szidati]
MKSLTVKLSQVGRCRLPGWGPRDSKNQWLETLGDMAQNRCQWLTQMYSVSVIFHIPLYYYSLCFTLILVKTLLIPFTHLLVYLCVLFGTWQLELLHFGAKFYVESRQIEGLRWSV